MNNLINEAEKSDLELDDEIGKSDLELDDESEKSLGNHTSDDYPDILVKMTKEQFSIFELKRRYEKSKTLLMNPDFQRQSDLWKSHFCSV